MRQMLKSKLHRATITATQLNYKGSIGIDASLLKECDLVPGERVQVLNFNNGERLETYVIEEKSGSGSIVLYGPAARRGAAGDVISVLSYCLADEEEARTLEPKLVMVDGDNRVCG